MSFCVSAASVSAANAIVLLMATINKSSNSSASLSFKNVGSIWILVMILVALASTLIAPFAASLYTFIWDGAEEQAKLLTKKS